MAHHAKDRIQAALSKHQYTLIKKIGEGSLGEAILVQHDSEKDRDTKAIVKMIDISRGSRQEREDSVKETKVLASLKHPFIVRYREIFHENGWLCIAMDYCEEGDLSERIKKNRRSGRHFPQDQILRWFTQSVLALKYIHDMHILHRDLESGKFFLSKSGNIKMGDFGIAKKGVLCRLKVLGCAVACPQIQVGEASYPSPEICQGKPYAWGSEIWSMGCVLYEMCANRAPFDAPDLETLIKNTTRGPTPELSDSYSPELRVLQKELLEPDSARRPAAAEILKKPLVQEVVRKMLEEVKKEEESTAGSARPAAAAPAEPSTSSGENHAEFAGSYTKSQLVEYYSPTHGAWLPATVTNTDADGRIMLNVKPNVCLSLDLQSQRVRPR